MADEHKEEVPVQAAGFATMGMGDHVIVRQPDGIWKPGAIVDCMDVYTVMYTDGTHGVLKRKTFTLQRLTRASRIVPGADVLVPVNAEDPTKLLPGVVTSVGDLVRVVVGEQGVDWTWTHGGDSGISGLHNDSQQATLQVLNADNERAYPRNQVMGGLHWLRLTGGGAEGLSVDPSVLFDPKPRDPGAVEQEYGFMRWVVPGSRGDPAQFTPFLSGSDIMRAAATMFDLDGDGALNAAEYNAFQNAQFGLSALKDYVEADEPVTDEAEEAKVGPDDLQRLAESAGYHIKPRQPIPLDAIPSLWKVHSLVRAKRTRVPGQQRLLWELANVLVVRLGHGLKSEHMISVYEGRPERTPADKVSKFLAALPKLYLASSNPKLIAASTAAIGLLKTAIMAGQGPAMELIISIREAIKAAIVRAPRIVMTFVETLTQAWNDAPRLLGPVKDKVLEVLDQLKDVLADAGLVAHAAIVSGMRLGAQFATAAAEAARNGAAIASGVIMQAHGVFVSAAAQKLGVVSDDLSEMLGSAGSQVAASLKAAMGEMQTFCSRETLENLADAASDLGNELRSSLPTLASLGITIGQGAAQGVANMPDANVDDESIMAAAKEAAAAAGEAVGAADDAAKAAMQDAAAALAGAVPLAVAACRAALEELRLMFRVAAKAGAPIADDVQNLLTAAVRTGKGIASDALGTVTEGLAVAMGSIAPCVAASVLAALRDASAALPSLAAVHDSVSTAVAEAGMALRVVAMPEALHLLGGVGEGGKLVAASVGGAFGKAMETGAEVTQVARAQVVAAANDAAAATRVASAEASAAIAAAALSAHNAAGNLDQTALDALTRSKAVASAAAAEARAAAAFVKVQGLEAIQSAPAAASAAATEAQASAGAALTEARLVASMMAAEAKDARNEAVKVLRDAVAAGKTVGAVAATASGAALTAGAREAALLASAAAASADEAAQQAAILAGAAAEGARAASREAFEALVDASQSAAGVSADLVNSAGEAAAYAAASTRAALAAGMEGAGPAVSAAAESTVEAAKELREAVAPGVKAGAAAAAAGARAAASALAAGAAAAAPVVQEALQAAVDALPDDVVNGMSAVLATARNVGIAVFTKLAEVARAAVDAAIDAGRLLAPFIPQMASAAAGAAGAAATAAAAAAGTLSDAAGNVAGLVGPAAAAAGASLGAAVGEAGDMAGAATEYLANAAGSAGDAFVDGAGAAAEGAGAAAGAIGAAGASALSGAVTAGQSFFESGLAAGKDVVAWANVDDALAMSQEALGNAKMALLAVGTGCFACCSNNFLGMDCIKFDIIRDFFQMVGLFFRSIASKSLEFASNIWGRLSNLVAVDINFVFPSISPLVIYIAIGVVALALLIAFIVFMCKASSAQPDAIREGHEVAHWDAQHESRKKTVRFLRLFLQACLSVYLPVSRSIFQILVCERTMALVFEDLGLNLCTRDAAGNVENCKCNDWEPYLWLQIASGILLLGFTIMLPIKCYQLIKRNKPVGSREDPDFRYDDDGHKVPYTDAMYNIDLHTRPDQLKCPYLFLYKGYERRWAYYKVLVMVLKFMICLPVIIFWDNVIIQTLVTLGMLALFSAASLYTSPFIDPNADKMDNSARLTAVLVLLFAFLGSKDVWESGSSVLGICIHIVNFLNIAILCLFTLAGAACCRRCIQDKVGAFLFKDTCLDVRGRAHDIVPNWDINREVKHRIWHAFWTSVIMNKCSKKVQERFAEIQLRVADVGRKKIEAHFNALLENPVRAQQRMWVQQNLEGVDVFFDGVSHDGHLDSVTKFGKMYINPFPFECVMVYDDCDDYTLLYEAQFDNFVNQNRDPDVVARRRNRQAVRALNGQMCHLEHSRMESHTVPDGTETYTDSEGHTHTRQKYATVQVLMHYHNGRMSVSANSKKRMAPGFNASLNYSDGHGVAVAPSTGQHHNITNSYSMPMTEFGMNQTFRMTARLQELFDNNRAKIDAGLIPLHETTQAYRRELIAKRHEDEQTLSSGFWLYVFDNYRAPREAVENYLRTKEVDEVLQTFPVTMKAGLDFLYSRMGWVFSHPCSALWWVFFDDLWEQNKDMKIMNNRRNMFDSRSSDSLAYHPMKRDKFCERMEKEGLRNVGGCRGGKKFFSDSVVAALFDRMELLDAKHQKAAAHTPQV